MKLALGFANDKFASVIASEASFDAGPSFHSGPLLRMKPFSSLHPEQATAGSASKGPRDDDAGTS